MPTEKQLEQMRAALVEKAKSGDADETAKLLAVYDLVTGNDPGPEPED